VSLSALTPLLYVAFETVGLPPTVLSIIIISSHIRLGLFRSSQTQLIQSTPVICCCLTTLRIYATYLRAHFVRACCGSEMYSQASTIITRSHWLTLAVHRQRGQWVTGSDPRHTDPHKTGLYDPLCTTHDQSVQTRNHGAYAPVIGT